MPSPGRAQGQPNASALIHHDPGTSDNSEVRLEDSDHGFERPPPKSAELFNPKVLRRPAVAKAQTEKEKERVRGDGAVGAVLVGQVEVMTLEGKPAERKPAASEKEPPSTAV